MEKKQEFLALAKKQFGNLAYKNREMLDFAESLKDFEKRDYNWVFNAEYKVARGEYRLPDTVGGAVTASTTPATPQPKMIATVHPIRPEMKFNPNASSEFSHAEIPARDKHYVPFGDFKDVETLIRSNMFFPIFISGMSGNGKTFMVEQACSRAKRALIRVQMTRETDEDDLIGGFRLIDGETKYMKGPALRAMELGAVLLIDEADRADPGKIMCLQGILEGKPYYVKKTGEIVYPQPGFTVVVTANTKGKGSEDGRYVAAGILDDAWLERFPITIEQKYPSTSVETRILKSYLNDKEGGATEQDLEFASNLISWADIIRKTFEDDGIDEVVSTRRLVHIISTYRVFGDRMRAINLCTNRFDVETKNSFMELYSKVDSSVSTMSQAAAGSATEGEDQIDF